MASVEDKESNDQLSFQVGSLRMKNPVMLASGVIGSTFGLLPRIAEAGAGAMVTKSISLEPRSGYKNPTIVEVECGYINAVGLSNPGVEGFKEEIMALTAKPIPVIVSLFGSKPNDFETLISKLESPLIDAYEINLSCPHVEKVGLETRQAPVMVSAIVRSAKNCSSKPVFVKVSPNLANLVDVSLAAESGGADGITAINTVKAMTIDIETCRPVLSNRFGGLSGPAVKPIAVKCVYDIYSKVNIPIIGCGGISDWADAVEFILAGASAIQIGSAVGSKGLDVFGDVVRGIQKYMFSHGFLKIGDMVGQAHSS